MSRPAWLGPPPTGAHGELLVLRGQLAACSAYTTYGLVPPAALLEALAERVQRLAHTLRRELRLL